MAPLQGVRVQLPLSIATCCSVCMPSFKVRLADINGHGNSMLDVTKQLILHVRLVA